MNKTTGKLSIVATPIGNPGDMVPRAVEILQSVDVVAAEDTRRAGQLFQNFDINTPLRSYHDHNELAQSEKLLQELQQGMHIALISDAGMPLISDPGYRVVSQAREHGIEVSVIPGPCAAIVALAGSGLPSDKFVFAGFPPSKAGARRQFFGQHSTCADTQIFYESSHRILASLKDMAEIFGGSRRICVARELTKTFETWMSGEISGVIERVESDPNQQKGEFVIVMAGADVNSSLNPAESDIAKYMAALMQELPIKKAAALTADLLGLRKKECYEIGLKLK